MTDSYAARKGKRLAKKAIIKIIISLISGKLGLVAAILAVIMFIGIITTVAIQSVLSYIPNFSLSCFINCNDGSSGDMSPIGKKEIPERYLDMYYAAEKQYNVPWNVLAAVHRVETTFSTLDPMISSVGAIGHMQFMPKTWIGWQYPGGTELGDVDIPDAELTDPVKIHLYGGYGVDGNGDGRADPFDVQDAIYAAAHFLAANGGSPFDAQKALYAYNHSDAYVDEVISYATRYADGFSVIRDDQGDTLPYDSIAREWMQSIPWTDPITGGKHIGLTAELQAQAFERDIRVSQGMVLILAEKSGRVKKEEKAREFAKILEPRDLKVIVVKKTGTTTTTTPLPKPEPTGNPLIDNLNEGGGFSFPVITSIEEDITFISEVSTYRGKHTFTVGYEEGNTTYTDPVSGVVTTTTMKTPVLMGTQIEKSDKLLDAALKKGRIRGEKGKLEFLVLTRVFDPNFFDERLINEKDLLIFESSGGVIQWPTPGFYSISSPYGYRKHPVSGELDSFHAGMDVPVPVGTPVIASADGEVVTAATHSLSGNHIKLDHGEFQTHYLHLRKMHVKVGEKVRRGQVIGESGNTGNTTGPHLHFEVIIGGKAVDPYPYLKNKSGGAQ